MRTGEGGSLQLHALSLADRRSRSTQKLIKKYILEIFSPFSSFLAAKLISEQLTTDGLKNQLTEWYFVTLLYRLH